MSEQAGASNFGTAEDFKALRHKLSSLEKKLDFQHLERELEQAEAMLHDLPLRLQILQESGIAWRGALSEEVARQSYLMKQAGEKTRELIPWTQDVFQREIEKYRGYIDLIEPRLESGNKGLLQDQLVNIGQKVEALTERRDRDEEQIRACYAGIKQAVQALIKEIRQIERSVQMLSEASFMLNLEEALVEAVTASYHGDDEPITRGVLFLTDRRLLFEQREEVDKRRWIAFKKKQYVQELRFAEPLAHIREMTTDRPLGSSFTGETLNLALDPPAEVEEAYFKIDGDLAQWQSLLERVRAGRFS